ncbi:unnamed protein product [Clavelina lepadiformis]|uniref:CDT1 Geminin-binding domain-containing protein n=1 Tax=Clavelina lepadiformis TaxID=159417 RepID=A0ABP0GXI3_CLALP
MYDRFQQNIAWRTHHTTKNDNFGILHPLFLCWTSKFHVKLENQIFPRDGPTSPIQPIKAIPVAICRLDKFSSILIEIQPIVAAKWMKSALLIRHASMILNIFHTIRFVAVSQSRPEDVSTEDNYEYLLVYGFSDNMAQQAVVTDYFTRKRQRGFAQPSKRRKLIHVSDDHCSLKNKADVVQTKSNRCVQSSEDIAAAQLTQSSTRKLKQSKLSEKFSSLQEYFSPVSKRNDIADLARSSSSLLPEECCATTASSDNHNIPLSPSKRSLSNNVDKQSKNKRGRISPRKESASAYDFPTPANDPETNFTQILSCKSRKSSRKRLVLTTTTEEVPAEASQDIKLTKASQMAKQLLSKKETSLNDLQEVLKSKGRLKDLQETLLKVKALKKQVKEAGTKETKPEKKQVTTKKDYAYQRLHSLAQDIPRGLSLPYKFKVLQEMFKSADTVISMLFNRQETATWLKVQGAVKDMIRKTFQQKDLGKIAHVFPTAYKYRQERGVPTYNDCMKRTDYQLTIEPVLPEKETSYGEGVPKLTSGLLVQRRHHFHLKMLEIVKQHHQQFLNELDPPLKVNSDELRRWHPQFALDKVPDIPSAELPSPPDQEQRKCCSAKDALEKTKGRLTKKVNIVKWGKKMQN